MAVIEQLEYGNAFTYRKCTLPLSNQGFVYLCGKNGTGKSTPWEILQHVFYGTTSRGLKKKGIVCTVPREDIDEDDSFWAEAILRNDSGQYEGRWLIKQKQPLNASLKVEVLKEVNGDWKKKWGGGHPVEGCPPRSPDAQKLASDLIGLRQNEFEGCLYLSQSGAHTLIEGVPSERMLYLSRLFGIDICDDIHKELKERLKKLNVDLEDVIGLEARAVDLQERISGMRAVKEILEDIAQFEEASELASEKIEDWKTKRDKARDDVKRADDRAQLQDELDELGDVDLDSYEEITADLKNSTQRRDTIRDDIQSAKMRDSIVAKIEELGPQVDDVPDNVDEVLEEKQTERAKLTADVTAAKDRVAVEEKLSELDQSLDATDLEERIAFVEKDLEVKRQKYKADTAQHTELSDLIEKAGKGSCPTCHRPLNVDDMVSMRDKLEKDLQTLYEEILPKKKKVADLKAKLVDAKKVRDLKSKLEDMPEHDLSALREQRAKLKTEINRLTSDRDKINERSSLEEQLEEMPEVDGLEDLQEELSKLDEKIPKLTADVERLDKSVFLKQRIEKIPIFDKEEAEEELDLANEVYDEVQRDSEEITKRLVATKLERDNRAEVQNSIDDVSAKLEALSDTRRRKRTLEYAAAAMPRLKKRKLHKVICAIRDILPRYAGTMFSHEPNTTFLVSEDEESLELVCRRLVKVHGRLEPVFVPVKGFSGGEKQRLSVALLFTLHALLDPTKRPDLLVLDEVDKGLDEMGVASLMALVNEVRSQYGTVIMTSHRTEISGADFDRVWRVTKGNEESTLALTA